MKFFVFFFLCCVALASAAPQLLTWPGLVGPVVGTRTIVAGPTVVNNGVDPVGRIVVPGYVGVY